MEDETIQTISQEGIIAPTIEELVEWHNNFGRMLEPNKRRTKLFGVDGKEVKFMERSRPEYVTLSERDYNGTRIDNNLGYSNKVRKNGSESDFRLATPDGRDVYLTYPETDLVLGSNYSMIDGGYASPSPFIRKILFKADQSKFEPYNAFEIGNPVNAENNAVRVPIIYYSIPEKRFRKLRNYGNNLDKLVEAVKLEREELKGSK